MIVAVSGSSGLVGKHLTRSLRDRGDLVLPMARGGETNEDQIGWRPGEALNPTDLERVDAVVHLAGESIAGRWSESKKQRILSSRVDGTQTIVDAINACDHPPPSFICASAVGFYGDRGDQTVNEFSPRGDGFLADVVHAWETTASLAKVRTVTTRLGIVLAEDGGALAKMLTPFKLGVGGTLGSGEQYMSWVAIDDVVRAIVFCIDHATLKGPVNVTSPNPVTNQAFTQTLGRTLRRPTILPVPKIALKMAMGEAADEMLLVSQRATPSVLLDAGFEFQFPTLESALEALLGTVD